MFLFLEFEKSKAVAQDQRVFCTKCLTQELTKQFMHGTSSKKKTGCMYDMKQNDPLSLSLQAVKNIKETSSKIPTNLTIFYVASSNHNVRRFSQLFKDGTTSTFLHGTESICITNIVFGFFFFVAELTEIYSSLSVKTVFALNYLFYF